MKAEVNTTKDIEAFINESPELAEARENGVDLWALWHNLHRSYAERLRRHDIALDTYRKLQQEGIIDKNLSPDDSGLSIDFLLQLKELMNQPGGLEAVRELEAIKKMDGEKNR
jgi:hypothetical protein